MAEEKIKLNKTELKKQKDLLKQRQEFLPVLELKKQQLQIVVDAITPIIDEKKDNALKLINNMSDWYKFFTQDIGFPLNELYKFSNVETSEENVAGVDVPNFEKVNFIEKRYDLFVTPPWVDTAKKFLRKLASLKEEINVLETKKSLLAEELRQTTIRVNLFEKILLPQHKENIKKIKIYLGDLEVAAISIAKIAKKKIDTTRKAGV